MRHKLLLLIVLSVLLSACSQPTTTKTDTSGPVTPAIAVSELVVGTNRIALGLIQDNSPVNDPGAKVHLRFYDRADTSATAKNETDAKYYGEGLPAAIWAAPVTFDRAGEWDMVVETQLTGQTKPTSSRLRFQVLETTQTPNVGQKAVSVATPTTATTPSDQLSSGAKPNPALYQISLDDALKSGKPTVVLFATPGFCRTAMCGPNVSVLGKLQEQFGGRMNFIHVEVYKYPFAESFKTTTFSNAMAAWKLPTEPWLFLIDKGGVIKQRYEGGITVEELTPVLESL